MVFMDLLELTIWLISPNQFLYVPSLPESILRASFNQTADDPEQVLQNPKAFQMLGRLASGQVNVHMPLPFSEPLPQSFGFNLTNKLARRDVQTQRSTMAKNSRYCLRSSIVLALW